METFGQKRALVGRPALSGVSLLKNNQANATYFYLFNPNLYLKIVESYPHVEWIALWALVF